MTLGKRNLNESVFNEGNKYYKRDKSNQNPNTTSVIFFMKIEVLSVGINQSCYKRNDK